MGQEFELKYRASAEQIDALRASFGPFREITMETAYYDTPDRGLSARKWTLRRRFENGVSVCTIKTPGEKGARGEWEVACGNILEAVPELCKLGCPGELAGLVSGGVVQVCGARFTRQAVLIEINSCTLELALDQGALLGSGREAPLCEVEVELKSGSQAGAVVFAEKLAARFGLVPETASKYRRALALAAEK